MRVMRKPPKHNGNFYISAFSMYDNENAYLVGINPSELRAALNE